MTETVRDALVIGAYEFVDPKFQRLRSPAQDVDALAGVLGDDAIGGFQVRTLVNQDNGTVQQELERFFSARKPDDLLLLYFSCHGVKDPAGRLYFVTSNTTFDLLRSTGVSAAFVSEQMEYSRSKRIIVLLDCCYSGAFLKGFRARGDDTVAVEQLEGRGRAVITASRATEYAFEADELAAANVRPSMFTGAIVDGLGTGKADTNGDGIVTVDELYDYVYDAVRDKVATQTPGRWVDVEGDLIVARNPHPPPRAAVVPPELQRALESDLALQRLGATSELAKWFRGDDPARQVAAAGLLERLTTDYDERVKLAALTALGRTTAPVVVVDEPEPAPSPAPAPAPVIAAAETPIARPPPPVDRKERFAGYLAAVAGVGVLLAPYLTYLTVDGDAVKLTDREWFSLGSFVLFALAVFAATCLLRPTGSRGTGVAVLVALLPIAIGWAICYVGELARLGDKVNALGPGWVMQEIAFLLLAVAGLIALRRARHHMSLSPRAGAVVPGVGVGAAAGALAVGVAVSLGWAQVLLNGGSSFFQVPGPSRSMIVRMAVVVVAAWVAWRRLSHRAVVAAVTILFVLAGVAQAATDQYTDADYIFGVALVVVAAGALLLPVLSTVLRPAPYGLALLAAWLVGSAAWVPNLIDAETGAQFLGLALVAGGGLAALSALRRAARPGPGPAAAAPRRSPG